MQINTFRNAETAAVIYNVSIIASEVFCMFAGTTGTALISAGPTETELGRKTPDGGQIERFKHIMDAL